MEYSPLHARLGYARGPLSSEMIDEAVGAGIREGRDLDWKRQLPSKPSESDFPKDVAAMANSGGGLLVYGVVEAEKAASGRFDVGGVDERMERTLRAAAASRISPPVLNLQISQLVKDGPTALAILVPASVDGPHLVFNNQLFGAPYRNDADTGWMTEAQLAAAYRSRFEMQRQNQSELERLYEATRARAREEERVWLVAVARRRALPISRGRLTVEAAASDAQMARTTASRLRRDIASPLQRIDVYNPRSGFRSKVFKPLFSDSQDAYREAWIALHDGGSVAMAAAVGGGRTQSGFEPVSHVSSWQIEAAVADFMALVHSSTSRHGAADYDVLVGLEWAGGEPILMSARDDLGYPSVATTSIPQRRFERVALTFSVDGDIAALLADGRELAMDMVNQGGLGELQTLNLGII